MLTYRIKEKFWFWDADFWIQDEKGHNLYKLNKKWFSSSVALNEGDDELLIIRKPLFALKHDCYQIVRNKIVLAEIKEKLLWFQHKHVLELADVEYVVDESKWNNNSVFTIKNKGFVVAHVHKKMLDLTGSFWVDIDVDPAYYEGEALKEMCLTVLAACIVMLQLLHEQDRQILNKERKEALDKMPLQAIHEKVSQTEK
jgi:uncharacterized protein YxjI